MAGTSTSAQPAGLTTDSKQSLLSTWERERVGSLPNAITLVRTVVSMGLAVGAFYLASVPLLLAAYLVYWFGDMMDGFAARKLCQETRIGAVFDIVCDRACTTLAAAAFIRIDPESTPAIGIFLFQFCVVDTMLTLSFLAFPISSPNYFFSVDAVLYRLNWHWVPKVLNTTLVVALLLANLVLVAGVVATLVLGMKVYSVVRIIHATRNAHAH